VSHVHDMREKKTGKVVIEDINPIIFNDLLHYIYSGRIPSPLNEKTAQLMFMAADKYNIDDLKEYCVTFLLSQMQATNALDLLIWAHLNSIEKIKEASLNFVAANGKVIFQTSEWEKIITAHPDLCLLVTRRV
jgi:speckle-type POZ protein